MAHSKIWLHSKSSLQNPATNQKKQIALIRNSTDSAGFSQKLAKFVMTADRQCCFWLQPLHMFTLDHTTISWYKKIVVYSYVKRTIIMYDIKGDADEHLTLSVLKRYSRQRYIIFNPQLRYFSLSNFDYSNIL